MIEFEEAVDLEELIKKASEAYYTGSGTILTDDQFDTLVDQLREIDPNNPLLKSVGWGYIPKGRKGKHITTIGSLDKVKYPEIPKLDQDSTIETPKLDGISVVCYFINGKLHQALTREGVVVTDKMQIILQGRLAAIEQNLSGIDLFVVRGEVKTNIEYKQELLDAGVPNIRNWAAGVMNRKGEYKDLHKLQYPVYSCVATSSHTIKKTKTAMLETLNYCGFEIPQYTKIPLGVDVPEYLIGRYEHYKKYYEVDGVVLTTNSFQSQTIENDVYLYKETSTAYKFPSAEADVVVGNIEWATGSSGKVTPVIILAAPVNLSGAIINRVTAHNVEKITKENIGINSVIKITRSNEVIPYIVDVIKPTIPNFPTACPACGSSLKIEGAELYCKNQLCPPRLLDSIWKFIEIAGNPDGLGEVTTLKWIEYNVPNSNLEGLLKYIPILIQEHKEGDKIIHMQQFFGDHYGELLYQLEENLIKKYQEGLYNHEFWYVLNLKNLATSNSKKIDHINPDNVKNSYDVESIMAEKVPVPAVQALEEFFVYWKTINELIKIIGPETTSEIDLKVCITGSLENFKNRSQFEKVLSKAGIKMASVGKGTDYLVCNKRSSSSKFKTAEKLGIPIVTENEFLTILKEKYQINLV